MKYLVIKDCPGFKVGEIVETFPAPAKTIFTSYPYDVKYVVTDFPEYFAPMWFHFGDKIRQKEWEPNVYFIPEKVDTDSGVYTYQFEGRFYELFGQEFIPTANRFWYQSCLDQDQWEFYKEDSEETSTVEYKIEPKEKLLIKAFGIFKDYLSFRVTPLFDLYAARWVNQYKEMNPEAEHEYFLYCTTNELEDLEEKADVPTAQLFLKKPVCVEAIQWTGKNLEEIIKFCGSENIGPIERRLDYKLRIKTLESGQGYHEADHLDWIIKGVKGEFYPCKPDIFQETYEENKE